MMKPASEKQKEQVFFMESKAEMELNVTDADGPASAFQAESVPAQSDFSRSTAADD